MTECVHKPLRRNSRITSIHARPSIWDQRHKTGFVPPPALLRRQSLNPRSKHPKSKRRCLSRRCRNKSQGEVSRGYRSAAGHFGHSISAADNVESALAFVRAKHFDAIVSDLALPDGSGCDVIREAKRWQHLTGVALTANAEDDDIARGRDAGFDYHLTKPIDFAQLRA